MINNQRVDFVPQFVVSAKRNPVDCFVLMEDQYCFISIIPFGTVRLGNIRGFHGHDVRPVDGAYVEMPIIAHGQLSRENGFQAIFSLGAELFTTSSV
jgi:hypothetical protein